MPINIINTFSICYHSNQQLFFSPTPALLTRITNCYMKHPQFPFTNRPLLSPSEAVNLEEFTPYEVADLIKLYCRELPEPILTSKLSEILILVQESECMCVSLMKAAAALRSLISVCHQKLYCIIVIVGKE